MKINTLSLEAYGDLKEIVCTDVKADTQSTTAMLDVARVVYTAIGGKLSKDGFASGKGMGKRATYANYLAIFGSKDTSGHNLYNARVAYGKSVGEIDDETAKCQLHNNARDYLRRIKNAILSYIDGAMVFPPKPKSEKSKANAEKKALAHKVKMANDPKYAKAYEAKQANIKEATKVIETFEATYEGAIHHIDRLNAKVIDHQKSGKEKMVTSNLDAIRECNFTLASVVGVLEGKLVTRAKPKTSYSRKSSKK